MTQPEPKDERELLEIENTLTKHMVTSEKKENQVDQRGAQIQDCFGNQESPNGY